MERLANRCGPVTRSDHAGNPCANIRVPHTIERVVSELWEHVGSDNAVEAGLTGCSKVHLTFEPDSCPICDLDLSPIWIGPGSMGKLCFNRVCKSFRINSPPKRTVPHTPDGSRYRTNQADLGERLVMLAISRPAAQTTHTQMQVQSGAVDRLAELGTLTHVTPVIDCREWNPRGASRLKA